MTYEAEDAKIKSGSPEVSPRQPYDDRSITWSGTGFMKMHPYSSIEFKIDNLPESKFYDIVVRFEPQISGNFDKCIIQIDSPIGINPNGPCANYTQQSYNRQISLQSTQRHAVIESICLEKNSPYLISLNVNEFDRSVLEQHESPSILIDSVSFICLLYSFVKVIFSDCSYT